MADKIRENLSAKPHFGAYKTLQGHYIDSTVFGGLYTKMGI